VRTALDTTDTLNGYQFAPHDGEFLPHLLAALNDGVMVCAAQRDANGVITDFDIIFSNPAAAELTTALGASLTGKKLLHEFPQMRRDGLLERFAETTTTGVSFAAERFFGQTRKWLRIVAGVFQDGVALTISEIASEANFRAFEQFRATTHTALQTESDSLAVFRQLRKRFDAIFNNTFQFTYLISTDGSILEMNQTALSFAGVQPSEVIGYPLAQMRWWSDAESAAARLEASLYRASGGELVRYTTEFINFEGKPVPVDFSLKPMFNESGDVDFFVAEGRDVTAMKQMEFERDRDRELADSLQKLNELKNEFVSSVSHELRTPLASIMGFAQTLLRDPNLPTETAQKFLNIILEDGQRLSRLVEDLLDLSRIESGRVQIVKSRVNLFDVIDYAAHIANAGAAAKAITLDVERPAEQILVALDRDRITQVLVNLLDNAVKFTPQNGSVSVRVETSAEEGSELGTEAVCVRVRDTGIGIPEHELPRLFEKFYRVNQPGKEIRGTGLGLAIAKQIVELHGGTITVASAPNIGSTFAVTLPLS
jgi:PAS domain S-box-containing protein